jgi:hypothetical protein
VRCAKAHGMQKEIHVLRKKKWCDISAILYNWIIYVPGEKLITRRDNKSKNARPYIKCLFLPNRILSFGLYLCSAEAFINKIDFEMIPSFVFRFGSVFLKANSGMVWETWQMNVVPSLLLPKILLGVYIRKMEFLCLWYLRFTLLQLLEGIKRYVR